MSIEKDPPNPGDRTGTLERGFARVMAAVTNADDRERARLLRIADSADSAHDAYARIVKPDQQHNAAVHVLWLADAHSSAGTRIADPSHPMPGVDPSAVAPGEPDAFDVFLVHADDALLDALGADEQDLVDDQLTALLRTWRREVDAEPIDDLVDSELAIVTVRTARRRRPRPRVLVHIAAAAAVLAIAFAGVGLAARDALPGDTLWGITKALYPDHARSIEAAQAVKNDLRDARVALTEGNIEVAESKLKSAHAMLSTVQPDDDKEYLQNELIALEAQLPGNPS